jgi:hypothetical protein
MRTQLKAQRYARSALTVNSAGCAAATNRK